MRALLFKLLVGGCAVGRAGCVWGERDIGGLGRRSLNTFVRQKTTGSNRLWRNTFQSLVI